MAAAPTFASTPRHEVADVTTANGNRDGTGTITTVITGVAAGTRIDEVDVIARSTTTAGMIRLFTSIDNGVTWKLFDEIPVVAVTPSAFTACFRASRTYSNFKLRNATMLLGAATHNAENFVVHVDGGDFT